MNVIAGLDEPGQELRPVARLVERLRCSTSNCVDRLLLAPEQLHDRVPGVHLLDVPVERPGPRPLGGELLLASGAR